jgi:hypothetical protein
MQPKTTALALAAGALMTTPAGAAAQDAQSGPLAAASPLAGGRSLKAEMAAAHRRAERVILARRLRRLELRLAGLNGEPAPRRRSIRALVHLERWQLRNRIARVRSQVRVEKRYSHVKIPAVLASIAACESHGNPRAIGGGGKFRGKYQFDYSTWASVGGKGDPAAASAREQDMRAARLYARAGSSPWPVCGR